MSNAHFSFSVDKRHGLIRITTGGLFEASDAAAFLEARAAAHAELGLPPNQHMTLNDMRELKIQPQEIVAVFQQIMADPAWRSRRLTFVVPKTLARAQIGRAVAGRDCRCFDTPEEAEAWLTGADAAEQAPPARRYASR
jgi:hypothetical protein